MSAFKNLILVELLVSLPRFNFDVLLHHPISFFPFKIGPELADVGLETIILSFEFFR